MQNQHINKEELNREGQDEKSFEEKQAEAFKDFMEAHFGNPLCQECLAEYQ